MTETICVGRDQLIPIQPYEKGCPTGWVNTANPWPGFSYEVTPRDGSWSAGNVEGTWAFNDYSSDIPRTLVLKWTCQLAPQDNTAPPTITGEAKVKGTLRCNPGTWSGDPIADFDYVWTVQRGKGTRAIGRGVTYTLTSAEARQTVACLVTAYTANGTALEPSVPSRPSDPIVDAPPRVLTDPWIYSLTRASTPITDPVSTVYVGEPVTCDPGTWDQAAPKDPFTYQWLINGRPFPGEQGTHRTVKVPPALTGDLKLSCKVTAQNLLGEETRETYSAPIKYG
jgi:hypothetical protein